MKKPIIFAVLILLASGLGRLVDGANIDASAPQLGQLLWLIIPLLVAVLFHLFHKTKVSWGLNPRIRPNIKWYILSILFFPVLFFGITELGIAVDTIERDQRLWTMGFFLLVGTVIPMQFIKNIFEEFVWRGYLFGLLEQNNINRFKTDLFIGIVWAIWHFPYLASYTEIYHQMSPIIYVPLFFIGTVATAFLYGEIRRRSGTVWTAVILHTLANAFVNVLFVEGFISMDSDKAWVLAPAMDNIGYILIALIAATILYKSKN